MAHNRPILKQSLKGPNMKSYHKISFKISDLEFAAYVKNKGKSLSHCVDKVTQLVYSKTPHNMEDLCVESCTEVHYLSEDGFKFNRVSEENYNQHKLNDWKNKEVELEAFCLTSGDFVTFS